MEYKIFEVSKENDIDEEVKKIFKYWRNVGFPNYDKESYNYKKELDKIIKYDESKILINNNELKQTMHGCGFFMNLFSSLDRSKVWSRRTYIT